ncbi:LLM class flavin-dependent oxidoreductase [Streptomyces sp. NPDC002092]
MRRSTHDRFREVLDNALLAEELGFDGFGVGERHERPFISSSPPVVLSHVAASAIEFPAPEEARALPWTDEGRTLVQDRLDTRFVGSPARVADQLEQLQQATGADELLITTITHDHADRVRSYELPAEEWERR